VQQDDRCEFVVRLRHRLERVRPRSSSNAFWTAVIEQVSDLEPDVGAELLEGRVSTNLPYTLKEHLLGIATGSRAQLAKRVHFEITAIRYSSLDLGFAVQPVGALVRLFEGHFDYFQMFLQSYLPLAFVDAVRPPQAGGGVGWRDLARQLDVDLVDASDLIQRFRADGAAPESPSTRQRAAKWLWIASNTSLLVPALMALIFLYLAWQTMEERSKSVDRAYESLIQAQTKLLQEYLPLIRGRVTESLSVPTPHPPSVR
jgi:hypothetical protein